MTKENEEPPLKINLDVSVIHYLRFYCLPSGGGSSKVLVKDGPLSFPKGRRTRRPGTTVPCPNEPSGKVREGAPGHCIKGRRRRSM